MDDIPSLSNRPVGSRFVTQDEVESARARREEQWKAAYARLGQEPPPPQQEDAFDGRSLAEIAKQEEWEEKTKLGTSKIPLYLFPYLKLSSANQFRALEEDEIMFLDSLREKQEAEERERRQKDGEEVQSFKQYILFFISTTLSLILLHRAVAARIQTTNAPPASTASKAPPPKPAAVKKDKKPLKGVVVKRKAKSSDNKLETKDAVEKKDAADKQPATSKKDAADKQAATSRKADELDKDEAPASKRRKVSES
ncbi:hypothetical protein D9758_000165 [Tetrapyrgos nigripes]|uniref:FAM192A/Fyv6 N-terminal domain-containing protein n=1 Tax=Tetrapyrgos nigripes TaxID=182062 RepID=A0A8H5LYL1_9AGAR|nr:hypothetical protein D9758_000165 [Tetrapyrgos nigripes]